MCDEQENLLLTLQMSAEGLRQLPMNTQPPAGGPGDLGWPLSGYIPGAPLSLDQATISCQVTVMPHPWFP